MKPAIEVRDLVKTYGTGETVVTDVLVCIKNKTDNMFSERNFATTWFMYSLIAAEICGFALILGGFVYTQFVA